MSLKRENVEISHGRNHIILYVDESNTERKTDHVREENFQS